MSNPISRLLPSASNSGSDTMSKLLPSVPDMDTQLQLAAKMIDKNTATHKVKDRGISTGEYKTNVINFRVSTVTVPTSSSTL